MPNIALLSQDTIDKIAAGEVIERPSSVVKELVENAIDAQATAITIEIKEGGNRLIRITDNGCGIEAEQVRLAFLRHSTSKIKSVEDLLTVRSLGFRGEALSSIAAVSRVELITKTCGQLTGVRYVIEGSKEIEFEEIGAPDGTTFLVKDLFYNTPARRKFLKSAQTEGNYISSMVEKLALSHPNISFKFINNNQTKLHTSGNGNKKELVYHIFGREISSASLEVDYQGQYIQVQGCVGKPMVTRGNRNLEIYFINQRYVKSSLISKAIEEAYQKYIMQHQYPFTVLYIRIDGELLDVNAHPTKMELRFEHSQEIYQEIVRAVEQALTNREFIPEIPLEEKKLQQARTFDEEMPEPFEKRRLNDLRQLVAKDSPYEIQYPNRSKQADGQQGARTENNLSPQRRQDKNLLAPRARYTGLPAEYPPVVREQQALTPQEQTLFSETLSESKKQETVKENYQEITLESLDPQFLVQSSKAKHQIIGQLFDTYWLVQFEDKLYIIDQHAAHEKILYERMMKQLKEKEFTSQQLQPPIVVSLDAIQVEMFEKYKGQLTQLGYEVESFGGREYVINAVPDNLFSMDMKKLFVEMLDDFSTMSGRETPQLVLEKIASMSCKAAVKGNSKLSRAEIERLLEELLTLDNPYNCPHGRPTIISMTKSEIEKKFKRIV